MPRRIALRAGFALLAAAYLADAFTLFDHNEQMYVTAGRLVAEGRTLYRDFPFVQAPYWAWLLGGVSRLAGADGLRDLLAARGLVLGLAALSAWVLYRAARRALPAEAAAAVVLLVFLHENVRQVFRDTSNYALPFLLATAAFVVRPRSPDGGLARSAAAGALAMAAAGAKAYYLPLVPVLLAGVVTEPGRRAMRAAAFAAGVIAGAAPLLAAWAAAPEGFAYGNLGYHVLDFAWKTAHGETVGIDAEGKVRAAVDAFGRLDLAVFLVLLGAGLALAPRAAGRGVGRSAGQAVALPLVAAGVATGTILLARPVFPQYWAMVVPLAALAAIAALGAAARRPAALRVLGVVTVLGFALQAPALLHALARAARWEDAPLGRVFATNAALRHSVDADAGRVATLAPVHASGAGGAYPELAAGPFTFRSADALDDVAQGRLGVVSPRTVAERLRREPPAAVFTGPESPVDAPLDAAAAALGYRRTAVPGGTLWLPPEAPE